MSGLFLGVVKVVDKLRHLRVFRPPQMHGGEHGGNVDSLDPSIVRQEKIEKISWADGGVKAVGVTEATDPSVPTTFKMKER